MGSNEQQILMCGFELKMQTGSSIRDQGKGGFGAIELSLASVTF